MGGPVGGIVGGIVGVPQGRVDEIDAFAQAVLGERDVVGMVVDRQQGVAGRTMLRRRSSRGAMPRATASSCIADSTAKAGWVMPYPRSAPLGTVFV